MARYYKDVSRGAYQLQITPYGRDASHSFVSSQTPGGPDLGDQFIRDVIGQADTVLGINFATFDNDGPNGIPASIDTCSTPDCLCTPDCSHDGRIGDDDGYVDAVFVLAQGLTPKQYLWSTSDYATRDTAADGQFIKVNGNKGVTALSGEAGLINAYFQVAHDWGHVLGLRDLIGSLSLVDGYAVPPEHLNWWALGSFSVMGYPSYVGNRRIPYDPYSQIKLGWVDSSNIIEVDTPLYAESIPNFVTSGKIYKIKRSPTEYFLVTNHQGGRPCL
ncbi:MAG: hypothetical protein L0Y74_08655 [candidate division Zixibacteria bacterium]|nr:hypothetical protein [candidate division Zixibacteria bacterium]